MSLYVNNLLANGKVVSGRGTLGAIKGMWYQAHNCNSMTQPPIDLPTSDDARQSSLYRFAKQAEPHALCTPSEQ